MRTSTAVFYFALAGTACATSQNIDPGATHGGATTSFVDGGGDVGTAGFGGDPGAGGFGAGGVTSNGGVIANGGVPSRGGSGPSMGGSQGGRASNGGSVAGGSPPVTGGRPNGGASGAPPQGGAAGTCSTNEKVCGGVCVNPGPSNGCAATDCTPCSNQAPANGIKICNQGQCDFDCLSGFTKSGSSCLKRTSDGGTCNPMSCTNNCPLSKPCCKSDGSCGCDLSAIGLGCG